MSHTDPELSADYESPDEGWRKVEKVLLCWTSGPRIELDVPNGWAANPTCILPLGHRGRHLARGSVSGPRGWQFEWGVGVDG